MYYLLSVLWHRDGFIHQVLLQIVPYAITCILFMLHNLDVYGRT